MSGLVFAGEAGFICNWLGDEAWPQALEEKSKKEFNAATPKSYGLVLKSGGLAFCRSTSRAILVSMDQPEAALDLVSGWIGGEWTT